MKINNIDYNSNIANFLKMSEISDIENEFNKIINRITNEIQVPLGEEMKEGSGLDAYSININGESRANTAANDIYKQLALVTTNLLSSKEIIVENAKKHRDNEYETYIEKVQEEITRLESKKRELQRQIDNSNPITTYFGSYYQQKINVQYEIERWEEKKAAAETAWNKGD